VKINPGFLKHFSLYQQLKLWEWDTRWQDVTDEK